MICEADFVPLTRGIHNKVIVQVEEEARHVFVIDPPASVCLILGDQLSAVFRDELILLNRLFDEGAPSCDIGWSQKQVLFQASLDAAVLAGDGFAVPVVCRATGHAQIWVTFPHGQVAGTLFGVALRLAPAAREAVLALLLALAELLAEILAHHTRAGAVARMVGVITRLVFEHLIGRVIFLELNLCP